MNHNDRGGNQEEEEPGSPILPNNGKNPIVIVKDGAGKFVAHDALPNEVEN